MRARYALLLGAVVLGACRFPPPRIDVPATPPPEMIERGRYLADNVTICTTCHSERDWRYYGGPYVEETYGHGGEDFTELFLFPDGTRLESTNLTPSGVGDWSDRALGRAITGGIDPDGEMIFLMMPFYQYRFMARPDLEALVAYLRTLPEHESEVAERELKYRVLDDVGWMFVAPPALQADVPGEPRSARRGKYLANLASCRWCHTSTDVLGFPVPGTEWAGGMGFPVPEPGGGWVFSPNITPDEETGLGRWTEEQFIARFRASSRDAVHAAQLGGGGFNSPMAWSAYSGMSDDDLAAIYAFLMRRPKVRNEVPRWLPYRPKRKRSGVYDYAVPATEPLPGQEE